MKKKIINFLLAICLIIPCAIFFTACKDDDDDTSKVMNVSLNPSVEFVLDADDEVISVSATNDEGNFIIGQATFTGLSADEAVNKFLEISKENGYVISNSAYDFKIEISGEQAEELYNKVSASAKEYLSSANITLNVTFDEITKEELSTLVSKCMQELTQTQINAMSEEELLAKLEESRKETANLHSQELKEFYYESRAQEILMAKLEQLETMINNLNSQYLSGLSAEMQEKITGFATELNNLQTEINKVYDKYAELYLDAESDYQQAMQEYISAKNDLLEAQLSGDAANIAACQIAFNAEKLAFDSAKTIADSTYSAFKVTMNGLKAQIELTMNFISHLFNEETLNQAMTTEKNNFKNDFHSKYSSHISKNHWNELAPNHE